jgi:hypothetical protein
VSQNSQLHLTNDSFLYACQSEFSARTKKDGSFRSHLRFDPFLVGAYQRPNSATWQDFVQLVSDVIQHHVTITPQFRRNEPLNLETVSYFSCSIATLFADLETACKEMFGISLPIIPAEPPEYSPDSPVSKGLIDSRNLFLHHLNASENIEQSFDPFPEGSPAERQGQWACEVWDALAELIHKNYRDYADMAMGFAYWKYQESEPKQAIDWRVRPPVGEAFAKEFKPLQRRAERSGGGSGRGERSSGGFSKGDRSERGDRAPRNTKDGRHEQNAGRPPRHSAETRAPQGADSQPSRRKPEREKNTRQTGGRGTRAEKRDSGITSEQQLENSLQDVYKAIESLKSNASMHEIALQPSNSFIRRQQHSLAVELGFDTESRGEGRDRGVVIKKQGPLH